MADPFTTAGGLFGGGGFANAPSSSAGPQFTSFSPRFEPEGKTSNALLLVVAGTALYLIFKRR